MEFQLIVVLMFRLECVSNDVLTIFIFHLICNFFIINKCDNNLYTYKIVVTFYYITFHLANLISTCVASH